MPGRRATPEQIARVVTLREAGYTSAFIVQSTGLSVATVTRLIAANHAKKGKIQTELLQQARDQFLSSMKSEQLKELAATLIVDNVAHLTAVRNKMLEAIEALSPTDTKSAALTLRACAAYATALKASSDSIRPLLKDADVDNDELPVLEIVTLTVDDVKTLREKQRQEDIALNGELEDQDKERAANEKDVVNESE